MGTELELAPPIEVVETIDADLDVPEMVAHLYMPFKKVTLCGIPNQEDPHDRMHRVEHIKVIQWAPGKLECICGAPACQTCYARAMEVAKK